MRGLRALWNELPANRRASILLWGSSFLGGMIVIAVWDLAALLAIIFLIGASAALLRKAGIVEAGKAERWSFRQFYGRIRGMMIFAMIPSVWVVVKDFLSDPCAASLLTVLVLLLPIALIWRIFDDAPKTWA